MENKLSVSFEEEDYKILEKRNDRLKIYNLLTTLTGIMIIVLIALSQVNSKIQEKYIKTVQKNIALNMHILNRLDDLEKINDRVIKTFN